MLVANGQVDLFDGSPDGLIGSAQRHWKGTEKATDRFDGIFSEARCLHRVVERELERLRVAVAWLRSASRIQLRSDRLFRACGQQYRASRTLVSASAFDHEIRQGAPLQLGGALEQRLQIARDTRFQPLVARFRGGFPHHRYTLSCI